MNVRCSKTNGKDERCEKIFRFHISKFREQIYAYTAGYLIPGRGGEMASCSESSSESRDVKLRITT